MNLKDVMVEDLSFSTQRGAVSFLFNLGKATLYLPIIGTIMGIALVIIGASLEKQKGWKVVFGEGEHRNLRIVALSLCIAGLGLILLSLAIAGTVIKVKERAGILPIPETQRAIPRMKTRNIRPPSYLL